MNFLEPRPESMTTSHASTSLTYVLSNFAIKVISTTLHFVLTANNLKRHVLPQFHILHAYFILTRLIMSNLEVEQIVG